MAKVKRLHEYARSNDDVFSHRDIGKNSHSRYYRTEYRCSVDSHSSNGAVRSDPGTAFVESHQSRCNGS
jgi:hypothetical protein